MSSSSYLLATHVDLAPSIIFTIAFALVLAGGIWRYITREKLERRVLIEPLIFCVLRLASYSLRAANAEADGRASRGALVTEGILLGSAAYFVIAPLIVLSRRLLESDEVASQHRYVYWTVIVLNVGLVASVVLTIISATHIGSSDPTSGAGQRQGSAIIYVGIVSVLVLALGYFHFLRQRLPRLATYFLLCTGFLLMIPSAFRLALVYDKPGTHSVAGFWLALALPELMVAIMYFSANLANLVPEKPPAQRGEQEPDSVPLPRIHILRTSLKYNNIGIEQFMASEHLDQRLCASDIVLGSVR